MLQQLGSGYAFLRVYTQHQIYQDAKLVLDIIVIFASNNIDLIFHNSDLATQLGKIAVTA